MTNKTKFERPYKHKASHEVLVISHIESDGILEVLFYDLNECFDEEAACDDATISYIRINGHYFSGKFEAKCHLINQVHQNLVVRDLTNLTDITTSYLERHFPQQYLGLSLLMAIPGSYGVGLTFYSTHQYNPLNYGLGLNEPAGATLFFNTATGLLIAYTEPTK